MTTPSASNPLPIAVQNLRKIWESKKVEMDFNQTEAGKALGWSQGAISHYLNNITELGPAAVVKLANFLNVDPLEIDPTIISKLPHVRALEVTMLSSDITKKVKETVYSREDIKSFYVEFARGAIVEPPSAVNLLVPDSLPGRGFARLCEPTQYTANTLCAVNLKNEKNLRFYLKHSLPPSIKIAKQWAVMSLVYV